MGKLSVCKENMFYRIGSQCEFTKKYCIPCMPIIGPLSCVATSVLRMRFLHVVMFSKNLRWLAQTKEITLKAQRSFMKLVKLEYNYHTQDPKFVAVVYRWLFFICRFVLQKLKLGSQNGDHWRKVVVSTVLQ